MAKLMASTGKVVHAAAAGDWIVEPICTPYGTMGMRQKRYGRIADTHAVTCKQCLKKLVAAEAKAYAEAAERAETPDMNEIDAILAEGIPTANGGLLLPAIEAEAPVITVESGDKVTRDGVKGKVLEVCTRAGVALAAVAFGFDLVWVKVAELVAL